MKYLAQILLIVAITAIAFFTERTNSIQLMSWFGLAFVAYIWMMLKLELPSFSILKKIRLVYFLIGVGVLARLIIVFAIPNLSDDFYRFIWDGRLLNHGINPFLQLPSYYIEKGLYTDFLTQEIYQSLNSQNYFTVYPPVLQGVFWLATAVFPNSILGSVVIMKLVILACEMGSIVLIVKLLKHFNLPEKNVLWYALHPVVILELVGNIHFEAIMIFGSLLAIWLLVKNKWIYSAIAMGVAIVAKLLPLMFLPFLLKRLRWKSIRYYFIVGITVIILFLPLLNPVFIQNISESIGLYFQSFEYNGSIYYMLRWLGFQIEGYNMISYLSPWLSVTVAITVFVVALQVKEKEFAYLPQNMLLALTVFYLFSTTVHPWYITSLVAFSTLTRFRYAVVWAGLIFLTYINYSYEPFYENIWIVVIEYTVLFSWMIYELFFSKN